LNTILLVGASGQAGRCLRDRRPGGWKLAAPAHAECDIRDEAMVARVVARARPDVVINVAAYNHVDLAESEPEQVHAVNAAGPGHLARAAARVGARFIHVSTDYVFGGGDRPYPEDAPTHPLNVYGNSKREGEIAVLGAMPEAVILRTSWLFSEYGANFVKTMLRLAQAGRPLRVVDDQIGAPTYAGDLAGAIIRLAMMAQVPGGIYHFSGAEPMSWYGFAQRIFKLSPVAGLDLAPIPSSQHPAAAMRPAYSVLSCTKIRALGIEPPPLDAGLRHVVRTLHGC